LPVADHNEDEQKNGDNQEAARLRGIGSVLVTVFIFGRRLRRFNVRWSGRSHKVIVAPLGERQKWQADRRTFAKRPRFFQTEERTSAPSDAIVSVNWREAMASPSSNGSSSKSPARLLRFSVFEVDLAAGDLRKNGKRIRLQEQPFQVLAMLLDNAGRVVTRDELRQKIWPADTFVDFDHSLNTAVNKIRDSLGDSASSPRFIETLARRGYRFIAPVDGITASQGAAPSAATAPAMSSIGQNVIRHTANVTGANAKSAIHEPALHPELHVPAPHRGLMRALFMLIQAMFLVFYLAALSHLHDIDRIATSFLAGWKAPLLVGVVLVTGAIGIPLRFYLISAVAFDFQKLGGNFRKLFPFVLALDQLWAIAPFLLLPQIGVGLAFAATAALLYVPFSERTLVRMAYRETQNPNGTEDTPRL